MQCEQALKILKRYGFLIVIVSVVTVVWIFDSSTGVRASVNALSNLGEMIIVIPPIFLVLGLLDVWVPKQQMMKYMGNNSGLLGIVLAFVLGSAAAGPLYGAFPVARVLLKKGASFRNVFILLGAWSTTKIPMLMFEFTNLGVRFAATRLVVDLFGITLIALVTERLITQKDRQQVLLNANKEL